MSLIVETLGVYQYIARSKALSNRHLGKSAQRNKYINRFKKNQNHKWNLFYLYG